MSGALVGLLLGSGLLLTWSSVWARPAARPSRRRQTRRRRLADDLLQAGVHGVGVRALLVACTVLAVVSGLAGVAATGVPAIAGCLAVAAGTAPVAWVRARARRARAAVRGLWPEAVDDLVSAARAGLSLPEALSQLSVRGPQPLRPAFAAFAHDYRASGRFDTALDALKERLADPVADRIVEALRIAREVGGTDLGRLLRTLAEFLRDEAATRSELEARQSWTVNAARLAVAAPWIVLLVLSTRPESVAAYARPAGALVLVTGAVLTVTAYRVMLRIGRLPDEQRVLL